MQTQTSHSTLNLGFTVDKLLGLLEENFRWSTPTPNDTMEQIMYRAGQASIVEYVKQLLEEE